MLRFLEYGFRVKMIEIPDENSVPVDYPDDIKKVEKLLMETEESVSSKRKNIEHI